MNLVNQIQQMRAKAPQPTEDPEVCALLGASVEVDATGPTLIGVIPDASDCPVCRGECVEIRETNRGGKLYPVAHPCAGAPIEIRARLFSRACLPSGPPFRTATLDTITRSTSAVLRKLQPGKGVWMHGTVGCGKTKAIVALLRHLTLDRMIPSRFYRLEDLLAEIKSTYGRRRIEPGQETETEIIERVAAIPVLALDEIGKMTGDAVGDFETRVISDIVERRYNAAGLTTVLTSNLSPDVLEKSGDGFSMMRIVRRLREMATPIQIQLEQHAGGQSDE